MFAAAVTACATSEEIVVLGGPKEDYCPSQVRKLIWLRGYKRTLLPGVNEKIDLSQGVHKNIITHLKGVNKEIDCPLGVQRNIITCLKGVNEEIELS